MATFLNAKFCVFWFSVYENNIQFYQFCFKVMIYLIFVPFYCVIKIVILLFKKLCDVHLLLLLDWSLIFDICIEWRESLTQYCLHILSMHA